MYYFPSVTKVLVIIGFLLFYCFIVGYPIAQKITDKGYFELSFPITIAIISTLSLVINNIINVGVIQSIIIFIIPILISLYIQKPRFFLIKEFREKKCILILPIIMSSIVTSAIFIKVHGDFIALSEPIFDHIKVAIIDSITRKGFPIENPFLISYSHDNNLHYYYLWYLLASNISIIFNINGLNADIILTFISSFISLIISFFIITEICNKKNRIKTQYIVCLFLFSGSSVDIINTLTNNHLYNILSHNHPLETWLHQAVWVPQHLLSASFVVLSLYLLGTTEFNHKMILFLISLFIVSALGCSVWVGGITFFVTAIIIFSYTIVVTKNKKNILFKWLYIAFSSILLSAPLLYNMLLAPKKKIGHLIGISLYDTSVKSSLYDFIFFFIGAMPLWITAITISFYMILFQIFFKKVFINNKYIVLILIAIGSLLTALFLKSQIANNDLGWRSIIPFLISGSTISAIFFVQFFHEKYKYIILIIAAISTIESLQYSRMLVYGGNYFYPDIKISNFSKINHLTSKNDRILNNIHQNLNNQPLDGNILISLLLNRSLCFQNISYSLAFGPDWEDKLFRMDEAIHKLYRGEANQQDLSVIQKFKCNKILVTPLDPIWNKEDMHLKKVYADKNIKIFTIQ